MAEDGQFVDRRFLGSEDSAENTVRWARAARLSPWPEALAEVLSQRSDPLVEDLFQDVLDAPGIAR
ncbi:hypothetical protein ACFXGT_13225 [Streptomyces sp. NPDC059352]|uniref:hypothetical protein n=1 Tax=Streptomyces sp. NPDC059352 TaxID=3346810 RepID=UPI00369E4112